MDNRVLKSFLYCFGYVMFFSVVTSVCVWDWYPLYASPFTVIVFFISYAGSVDPSVILLCVSVVRLLLMAVMVWIASEYNYSKIVYYIYIVLFTGVSVYEVLFFYNLDLK